MQYPAMTFLVYGQNVLCWLLLIAISSLLLQTRVVVADLETTRSYLHIKLLNELTGERTEIKYKLMNENAVARKFEFLVHRHLSNPHEIQSEAWAVFPKGRDALLRTHSELKSHMDFIDNYRHKGQKLFEFKHKLPPLGYYNLI